MSHRFKKFRIFYKSVAIYVLMAIVWTGIVPPQLGLAQPFAPQSVLNLPLPGSMIHPTSTYNPAVMLGMTLDSDNPLSFDFIIDTGDDQLQGEALADESRRLINYFLTTLTVPDDQMWVNLSPNEPSRIMADELATTEMGRDLLAQDYLLKQLTSSLMYPEEQLGQTFWDRIYKLAQQRYGSTDIPTNTFNKVWIVPEYAHVYTQGDSVFVAESHLNVMLEEDYLNLAEHAGESISSEKTLDAASKELIREIIIPEIEREINHGKHFARLRQIYHSMILATWYKKNLRNSFLAQSYANKNLVKGIDHVSLETREQVYTQYLSAFKKGVFNYIKEDMDPITNQMVARQYFSGGITNVDAAMITEVDAEQVVINQNNPKVIVTTNLDIADASSDAAMLGDYKFKGRHLGFALVASLALVLPYNHVRSKKKDTPVEKTLPAKSDTIENDQIRQFLAGPWSQVLQVAISQPQDYNVFADTLLYQAEALDPELAAILKSAVDENRSLTNTIDREELYQRWAEFNRDYFIPKNLIAEIQVAENQTGEKQLLGVFIHSIESRTPTRMVGRPGFIFTVKRLDVFPGRQSISAQAPRGLDALLIWEDSLIEAANNVELILRGAEIKNSPTIMNQWIRTKFAGMNSDQILEELLRDLRVHEHAHKIDEEFGITQDIDHRFGLTPMEWQGLSLSDQGEMKSEVFADLVSMSRSADARMYAVKKMDLLFDARPGRYAYTYRFIVQSLLGKERAQWTDLNDVRQLQTDLEQLMSDTNLQAKASALLQRLYPKYDSKQANAYLDESRTFDEAMVAQSQWQNLATLPTAKNFNEALILRDRIKGASIGLWSASESQVESVAKITRDYLKRNLEQIEAELSAEDSQAVVDKWVDRIVQQFSFFSSRLGFASVEPMLSTYIRISSRNSRSDAQQLVLQGLQEAIKSKSQQLQRQSNLPHESRSVDLVAVGQRIELALHIQNQQRLDEADTPLSILVNEDILGRIMQGESVTRNLTHYLRIANALEMTFSELMFGIERDQAAEFVPYDVTALLGRGELSAHLSKIRGLNPQVKFPKERATRLSRVLSANNSENPNLDDLIELANLYQIDPEQVLRPLVFLEGVPNEVDENSAFQVLPEAFGTDEMRILGERFTALRLMFNQTRLEVRRAVNIPQQVFKKLEDGQLDEIPLSAFFKLAHYYGVDPLYILSGYSIVDSYYQTFSFRDLEENFRKNIKLLRESLGRSIDELATETGLSSTQWKEWEILNEFDYLRPSRDPSLNEVVVMAKALKVHPTLLLSTQWEVSRFIEKSPEFSVDSEQLSDLAMNSYSSKEFSEVVPTAMNFSEAYVVKNSLKGTNIGFWTVVEQEVQPIVADLNAFYASHMHEIDFVSPTDLEAVDQWVQRLLRRFSYLPSRLSQKTGATFAAEYLELAVGSRSQSWNRIIRRFGQELKKIKPERFASQAASFKNREIDYVRVGDLITTKIQELAKGGTSRSEVARQLGIDRDNLKAIMDGKPVKRRTLERYLRFANLLNIHLEELLFGERVYEYGEFEPYDVDYLINQQGFVTNLSRSMELFSIDRDYDAEQMSAYFNRLGALRRAQHPSVADWQDHSALFEVHGDTLLRPIIGLDKIPSVVNPLEAWNTLPPTLNTSVRRKIAQRLVELRTFAGKTRQQVIDDTGVTYEMLRALEQGLDRDVALETLARISNYYASSLFYILTGKTIEDARYIPVPLEDMSTRVASNLFELRSDEFRTIDQAAETSGIHRGLWGLYEQEDSSRKPRLSGLIKLARRIKAYPDLLIGNSQDTINFIQQKREMRLKEMIVRDVPSSVEYLHLPEQISLDEIGDRVTELMNIYQVSPMDMERAARMSNKVVKKVMRLSGFVTPSARLKVQTLAKISDYFNVSMLFLISGNEHIAGSQRIGNVDRYQVYENVRLIQNLVDGQAVDGEGIASRIRQHIEGHRDLYVNDLVELAKLLRVPMHVLLGSKEDVLDYYMNEIQRLHQREGYVSGPEVQLVRKVIRAATESTSLQLSLTYNESQLLKIHLSKLQDLQAALDNRLLRDGTPGSRKRSAPAGFSNSIFSKFDPLGEGYFSHKEYEFILYYYFGGTFYEYLKDAEFTKEEIPQIRTSLNSKLISIQQILDLLGQFQVTSGSTSKEYLLSRKDVAGQLDSDQIIRMPVSSDLEEVLQDSAILGDGEYGEFKWELPAGYKDLKPRDKSKFAHQWGPELYLLLRSFVESSADSFVFSAADIVRVDEHISYEGARKVIGRLEASEWIVRAGVKQRPRSYKFAPWIRKALRKVEHRADVQRLVEEFMGELLIQPVTNRRGQMQFRDDFNRQTYLLAEALLQGSHISVNPFPDADSAMFSGKSRRERERARQVQQRIAKYRSLGPVLSDSQIKDIKVKLDKIFASKNKRAHKIISERVSFAFVAAVAAYHLNIFTDKSKVVDAVLFEIDSLYTPTDNKDEQRLRMAINDLLKFIQFSEKSNRFAQTFVTLAAQLKVSMDVEGDLDDAEQLPDRFPHNEASDGEFWDLASGPLFAENLVYLDSDTQYVLVDNSFYASAYLNAYIDHFGLDNVTVRRQDVMTLERPERPIAVIRSQNTFAYVDGIDQKLTEMIEWLDDEGQIVLSTRPFSAYRAGTVQYHRNLLLSLIRAGWSLDVQMGEAQDAYSWRPDSLTLTQQSAKSKLKQAWAVAKGIIQFRKYLSNLEVVEQDGLIMIVVADDDGFDSSFLVERDRGMTAAEFAKQYADSDAKQLNIIRKRLNLELKSLLGKPGLIAYNQRRSLENKIEWIDARLELLKEKQVLQDNAMSTNADLSKPQNPGGIDLNPNHLKLDQRGEAINYKINSLPIGVIKPIEGITPVIIQIRPITNFPLLLGLIDQPNQPTADDNTTSDQSPIQFTTPYDRREQLSKSH